MAYRAILAVILLLIFTRPCESQTKVERGLRINADGSIRITNLVGSVRVTGWNRDSVALRGSLPKGDRLFMGGGLKGMKLFIEPMNDRNPQPSVLEVMVPAGAKLWVKTATAEIEVSGVTGELDLYVVGGRIRVSGKPAELNAEAIDGDIEVNGQPGWLRAKSASGSVTLIGSSPDVSISTVSGDVTVSASASAGKFERAKFQTVTGRIRFIGDIEKGSALDFDTHSGSVELTIPRTTGADLDVATIVGSISNQLNFGRPVAGRYGRGSELVTTNGDGGARITVRSFKGPVTLRRAQ